MNPNYDPFFHRGIRVLSLDGDGGAGGVKPLSQIKILRSMIEAVYLAQHGRPPSSEELDAIKPYEHFDLIVGTGTGGVLAVQIGRLHMNFEELEKAYTEFAMTVYGQPKVHIWSGIFNALHTLLVHLHNPLLWWKAIRGAYSTFYKQTNAWWNMPSTVQYGSSHVELVMKQQVERHLLDEESRVCDMCDDDGHEMMLREKSQSSGHFCRVAVTATSMANTQSCRLLRSYSSFKHRQADVTITQAIRATTASYLKFAPVVCDGERYISAAEAGYNNPALLAKEEVTEGNAYKSALIRCLISIGSGKRRSNPLVHPSWSAFWISIKQHFNGDVPLLLRPLSMMASDSENVHEGLAKDPLMKQQRNYFRFNVDMGEAGEIGKWNMEAGEWVNYQSNLYLNHPATQGLMEAVTEYLIPS
ncbi:hypothetical protein FRC14_002484 [Serendipita sp. 396]|nr:hypothetical protein FRC14_002484 [Serendipita sp. 396]KAG8782848.1 hypothetical protein FRC15_006177 [Serendipita sp. 397]KAG8867000.1 hypothetical protein FRC20_006998 [Serendipita sp. 405]